MSSQKTYIINNQSTITGPRGFSLPANKVINALHKTTSIMNKLANFEVDVFALLGMRNLSAFVGEVFAASMILEFPHILKKNPHQDGYPDLLLMDETGLNRWRELHDNLRDKAPFSPFLSGGFEVKATVGSVPPPSYFQKKGLQKCDIGDTRIEYLRGYDWKAHHRETTHLIGLVWDFIEKYPTVVGVFYRNDLQENDWGEIIQPREGGGRTTSVSIMPRSGVRKMYQGWVAVIDMPAYADFFNKYNCDTIIPS